MFTRGYKYWWWLNNADRWFQHFWSFLNPSTIIQTSWHYWPFLVILGLYHQIGVCKSQNTHKKTTTSTAVIFCQIFVLLWAQGPSTNSCDKLHFSYRYPRRKVQLSWVTKLVPFSHGSVWNGTIMDKEYIVNTRTLGISSLSTSQFKEHNMSYVYT